MHFKESDVYRDTSGKIRKINGALPHYPNVPQISNSTIAAKSETSSIVRPACGLNRNPSKQVKESAMDETLRKTSPTSEDFDTVVTDFQYEFLAEALEHPEGLGFKVYKNRSNFISGVENCKTCVMAESRSRIDERLYSFFFYQNCCFKTYLIF